MDFTDPLEESNEQAQLERIAAILARGITRLRALDLAERESPAEPLDSSAETRLSGHTVNGAERPQMKRAVAVFASPRRLSPQHPSRERARHG